jgi:hypothetical protein
MGTRKTMTSRHSQITLDVHDVTTMAAFWSAVLGYTCDIGDGGCAHLTPPAGGDPTMWLQAGAPPKAAKLRCPIDLRTRARNHRDADALGDDLRRLDDSAFGAVHDLHTG